MKEDMYTIICGIKGSDCSYISNFDPLTWTNDKTEAKQYFSIFRIYDEINQNEHRKILEKYIRDGYIDELYTLIMMNGEELGRSKLL